MIIRIYGTYFEVDNESLLPRIYKVADEFFETNDKPIVVLEKGKQLNDEVFAEIMYDLAQEVGFKILYDKALDSNIPHFLKNPYAVPCTKDITVVDKLIEKYGLEKIPYDLRETISYGYILYEMDRKEYFDYIERNMKNSNYEFIIILSKHYKQNFIDR